jgi:hypothetical protein
MESEESTDEELFILEGAADLTHKEPGKKTS